MSRLASFVLWWAALFGVWVLTLSTAPGEELIAAGVAGLAGALAAPAVRRLTGVSWTMRPRWLSWLAAVPVTTVVETVIVLSLPLRSRSNGRWRRIPMPVEEDEQRSTGRRAAAAFVLSATPATFVADSPPGEPLLVHYLASGRPRLDRMVTR
ncbi:MAG TPA: hypothetical protein VHC49_04950 [Mycobacteriales bacterium]|nr:hypothetical protein [Mycobacteriales bacterium]